MCEVVTMLERELSNDGLIYLPGRGWQVVCL